MHKVGSSEAEAATILDRALEGGINFIDSADVYGQDGLSERILGNYFERSSKRDRFVVATKFRFKMDEGPNGTGASRYRIMRCAEDSLRRLKTDRIDLYQIHMQDIEVPHEETLRALDDLVTQGKVLYLGASNYAAYRLTDALWLAKSLGLQRFVTLQAQYSLIVREIEREHVPLCQSHGLGILPWSPLASGFLSGKYHRDDPPPSGSRLAKWEDTRQRYNQPRAWQILDAVRAVARRHEATCSQVALAWLLAQTTVSSVIIGARTISQLEDNLGADTLELSADDLQELEKASAFDLGYPYSFMKRIQGTW